MAKYLVTGGAGFIGSNNVEELIERNESVRVLDNLSTGKRENIDPFMDTQVGNLCYTKLCTCEAQRAKVCLVSLKQTSIFHPILFPSIANTTRTTFAIMGSIETGEVIQV